MKLVIVGGVAGGASAAARARRVSESAEIVLFERGDYISFANCGLPYHIGEAIPKRDSLLVMTPERFKARTAIDVRVRQEITDIDPDAHTVTVKNLQTGESYKESYDKLIIATGSNPIRPDIPGADDPAVMTLWTLPDMDRIKARVDAGIRSAVVVGGGFLGIELAENLRHRKVEVTLVEMFPQVMSPLDPEMAAPLARELERNGVKVLLGTKVTAVRRQDAAGEDRAPDFTVQLGDGKAITADLVVLSIGVRPNSALAAAAGLNTGPRGGIVVDSRLQTSHRDIYAVGDAIQVTDALGAPAQIPLAGPANRQGRIAADNVFGADREYRKTFGTSVIKVFGLTAASTGSTEKALKKAGVEYEKIYLNPYSHAAYYPGAQIMHLKLLFTREGNILGAQIVGRDGVDKRIDVLTSTMQAGRTVYDLQDLELAYAPPYGSAKDPVNFAGYVASNVIRGDTEVVHADAIPGDALLLDVREPAEHAAGAIPGSRLMPLGTIRERMAELPRQREIVAYCAVGIRGYLAERILKQNGFHARNLSGGYTTWKLFQPSNPPASQAPRLEGSCGSPSREDAEPGSCGAPNGMSAGGNNAEHLDVRGLQCPGPIVSVKQKLDALPGGASLKILASDQGFLRDLPSFCDSTGHSLLALSETGQGIEAMVRKALATPARLDASAAVKRTTLVLFNNDLDRAIAALILATGFAAIGHEVSVFCTFWGLTVLRKDNPSPVKKDFLSRMFGFMLPSGARRLALSKLHMLGAGTVMMKHVMKRKNVPSLPELIEKSRQLGVRFTACEMAMNIMGIQKEELLDGVETAGVANFAALAERSGTTLFI